MAVEKDGEFVNVVDDPVTEEDVPEDVKREEAEVIDLVEAGKRQAVDLARCAALPEKVYLGNGDTGNGFVPEAEVELDRKRYLGIEGISSPSPGSGTNQNVIVIGIRNINTFIRRI